MITQRKAANAVGGRTARACESCLRKRARWYCGADDAFLCQGCDASVHSANQLASRHERVRLETSSFKSSSVSEPAWHKGFKRKARTPRHAKPKGVQVEPTIYETRENYETREKAINAFPLVPEMGGEETSFEDDLEEQLLYCVPTLDPYSGELCNVENFHEESFNEEYRRIERCLGENVEKDLPEFIPPDDMELLESLLGTGFDEDSHGIEGLGLEGCDKIFSIGGTEVKIEDENRNEKEVEDMLDYDLNPGLGSSRESLDWNFEYGSSSMPMVIFDEEKEQKMVIAKETNANTVEVSESKEVRRSILLNLNYEGVITAWADQGCPWTTGIRPEFDPTDDRWPDFQGTDGVNRAHGSGDGDREARVSRYREKRRTRLFSKKIRYEVRKLNAEKRPRMKGRFVKRTSFA